MMRLDTDLLDLILSIRNGNLLNQQIKWKKQPSITVVAAARGYPEKYKTKTIIKNLEKINNNNNQQMFHAGTVKENEKILSNGGRVLNATATAADLMQARNKAHEMLNCLEWEDLYFRKDIGWRVIK